MISARAGIGPLVRGFVATAAFLTLATPAAAAELLFVGDFEHGILPLTGEERSTPWHDSGNPPVVVAMPEPVRHGRFAMKSVLDRHNSPCSYRTEVVPNGVRTEVGKAYWYGFSVFFPNEWVRDNVWELVVQWHGNPDFDLGENWRNPVLAFFTDGVNVKINNIWDPKPNTFASGKREYGGSGTVWTGPITKGEWTDWVVHILWSYGPDGILEIWRNGERVADKKGPNCFNDRKGPYMKMGIYKGWRDPERTGKVSRRVIYHDEVRIAGSDGKYEDVAPPGSRVPVEVRRPTKRKRKPIILPDGTEIVIVGGVAVRRRPKNKDKTGDEKAERPAEGGPRLPGRRPVAARRPKETESPAGPAEPPEAKRLLKEAETLFIDGKIEEAGVLFRLLVREHPATQSAAKAREYLEMLE